MLMARTKAFQYVYLSRHQGCMVLTGCVREKAREGRNEWVRTHIPTCGGAACLSVPLISPNEENNRQFLLVAPSAITMLNGTCDVGAVVASMPGKQGE